MLKFSGGKAVVVVVFGLAGPIPIGADVPAIAFGVGTGDDAVGGWHVIGGCVGARLGAVLVMWGMPIFWPLTPF